MSSMKDKIFHRLFPVTKTIYLESKPVFSDNSYRLYLEMLKEKINEEYRIVWIYDDYDKFYNKPVQENLPDNVYVKTFGTKTIGDRLRRKICLSNGKLYISSNTFYKGIGKDQHNVYLNHGAPFKQTGVYGKIGDGCDAEICLSENLKEVTAMDAGVPVENVYITGFPRNDYLMEADRSVIAKKLGLESFEKIIIWMPTFRQGWENNRIDSDRKFSFGIPILNTIEDFELLNCRLQQLNQLLIVKIHFAQNLDYIKEHNLSNIRFMNNDELEEKNVQLYELIGITDALITDYSSIYFDYLLMDKPIGLTIDDLDDYLQSPGIVYDDYFEQIKGDYIKDVKDFISFAETKVANADISSIGDNKTKCHDYTDAHSSKRVLDLLRTLSMI